MRPKPLLNHAKNFSSQVATARTFGFVEQLETLWELGFARGGSLNNTVLVNGSDILNKEGLRFVDEFVRHKALDCIGNLVLDLEIDDPDWTGRVRTVFSGPTAFVNLSF